MKHYALISVFNKTGIEDFAKSLVDLGIDILSSGGTARKLKEAGLEVTEVGEMTGFPEILNGRVKTLHPKVHGGILARRSNEEDIKTLAEHGINQIDLVCVNLYPFAEALKKGLAEEELIEFIDIGGPTLLRAAAKNFRDVYVLTDSDDYAKVLDELKDGFSEDLSLRRYLAYKVFSQTAAYDQLISSYFQKVTAQNPQDTDQVQSEMEDSQLFPQLIDIEGKQLSMLRYGENPHQRAAFYRYANISDSGLPNAEQLHGKALSYNNIQDTNAALELLYEFEEPTLVALKHMNPCGIATAKDIYSAWQAAYEADPISIFGGIIAANREICARTAEEMNKIFLEIIIAPSFSEEALEILKQKKNIRLLTLPMQSKKSLDQIKLVSVMDGLLLQERDLKQVKRNDCELMTEKAPTEAEWHDLINGYKVVKHCKSNAIVVYKDGRSLGIGVGQSNRVGAARLALEQAGEAARGAILASDAFFPMPDTVELAHEFGISAIIQPGGSIRDEDSVKVCNEHGMSMVATSFRHFKH